ncbi:MAG: hypothetical protein UX80_C0006G0055 [Candidatus Amesbacteria bacterium GW2011_GWA2_47_11b]|uniref:Uncharacterized protein n=3 Tax=Candidatus Amesiibacteriota TaxID=1752730 RepID=A0A0G1USZ6_9BACT|nr:MAG: hypothetical protein UX42_C0003G0049 [Microgenomates group bacterium GW2011_GWC1_46_20]KKU58085.1 MAG: hypothetical protein UX80_C0006G0055 [Candidatus Amesbacteria bacterium GW2011_GWA2_47_11b]KKU69133.1 MAG: hypothetical protein UX92_C0014G0024 [Candidatus Amesbacteria bacterium GW2011_GWA1_47_20]KKU83810.1 MAG: hypothetical protein UY11_C0013G0008 [Candidatus Amesbacteria bacterium GW2011_GWC2_47_8]
MNDKDLPEDLTDKKSRRERRRDLGNIEAAAADGAAALENVAAGAGGHAGTETVFSNSFQFFGLPGTFCSHDQNYITKMYLKNCGYLV